MSFSCANLHMDSPVDLFFATVLSFPYENILLTTDQIYITPIHSFLWLKSKSKMSKLKLMCFLSAIFWFCTPSTAVDIKPIVSEPRWSIWLSFTHINNCFLVNWSELRCFPDVIYTKSLPVIQISTNPYLMAGRTPKNLLALLALCNLR